MARIPFDGMVAHLTSLISPAAVKLGYELAAIDLKGLSLTDPREVFDRVYPVLEDASLQDAADAAHLAWYLVGGEPAGDGAEAARHLSGVEAWINDRITKSILFDGRVARRGIEVAPIIEAVFRRDTPTLQ